MEGQQKNKNSNIIYENYPQIQQAIKKLFLQQNLTNESIFITENNNTEGVLVNNNTSTTPIQLKIHQNQQSQNLGDSCFSLQKFPSYSVVSQRMGEQLNNTYSINDRYFTDFQRCNGSHQEEQINITYKLCKNSVNEEINVDFNQPIQEDSKLAVIDLEQLKKLQELQNVGRRKAQSICSERLSNYSFTKNSQKRISKMKNENTPKSLYKITASEFQTNNINLDNEKVKGLLQKIQKKRNNIFTVRQQAEKDIWKKKWMTIITLISKMKRIVNQSALFFRPQQLREIQVRLLNDISSNQVSSQRNSSFTKFYLGRTFSYRRFQGLISFKNYRKIVKSIIKYFGCLITAFQRIQVILKSVVIQILKNFPLFHNLSSLYILWEAVIFIASSILFLYLPFEYSFNLERQIIFEYYIEYICPLIFGIDILIKCNTKSSEQGSFIEQHIQIFQNYLKFQFFIDLISVLCLRVQIFGLQSTYFLFFLRISQSFRILEIIREEFLLKMKMFGIISLLYLLAQVLYFGHLISCLWNYVGLRQLEYNEGWIVTYDFQNESIASRYLQTFYYAIVTMTTIGYGDFTAQTKIEKFLMIFIAFFSCGIFGYTINSIGINSLIKINYFQDIFNQISILCIQKRDLYLQELAKINMYFKQYNVDLGLQGRARKYIQYLYSDDKNDNVCSIKSLSNLSEYLQKEIQTNVYIKKLQRIIVFKEIFTDEILNELALQMKETFYSPDQCINENIEDSEPQLYFVNQGKVSQYAQYDSTTEVKEIAHFAEGQYFGLLQFLQGDCTSRLKYKSVGVSSILQIGYTHFTQVLRKYDTAFQQFCYLKDEVKFSKKLSKIHTYCLSCQQANHVLEECPYLFYEGKREVIVRKYIKEIEEKIKHFKRKYNKSTNAYLQIEYISQVAENYYQDNIEYFSLWERNSDTEDENFDFLEKTKEGTDKQKQEKSYKDIVGEQKFSIYNLNEQENESIKKEENILLDNQQLNSKLCNKSFTIGGIFGGKSTQEDDNLILEDSQQNLNAKRINQSQKRLKTNDHNIDQTTINSNKMLSSEHDQQAHSPLCKQKKKIIQNNQLLIQIHQPTFNLYPQQNNC